MRHSSAQLRSVLQLRALQHRSALTPSEATLFQAIRGGRIGTTVRRQVVLGRFIVDFFVPSANLVIEVDGAYHARRRSADARRDRWLGKHGYRVLRLNAELVQGNLSEAVARVRAALEPPG